MLSERRIETIRERLENKTFKSNANKFRYLYIKYDLSICQIQRVCKKPGKTQYYNIYNALNVRSRFFKTD